jgi:hypothetical protein
MEGTRPPTGASPTQPYKCGQYVKVNVKTALIKEGLVGATVPVARKRWDCGTGRATGDGRPYGTVLCCRGDRPRSPENAGIKNRIDFDFDFKHFDCIYKVG